MAQDAVGRDPSWEAHGHTVEPTPTHPLLSITVLQVVNRAVIPVQPDAHQVARQEAIFCQDHKVGEEATKSLDHSWGMTEDEERLRWGGQPAQGTSGAP